MRPSKETLRNIVADLHQQDPKNPSLREYGFGAAGNPVGKPSWEKADPSLDCPNCGGDVCEITVTVENSMLRAGRGTALYFGCPACPWASPALATTDTPKEENNE